VSGVCGVCTVKSRRRDNKNSATAERLQEEIEWRDQGNCETENSAVRDGGYSRQQVRVWAASRASSSLGSGQQVAVQAAAAAAVAACSFPGSSSSSKSCPGSGQQVRVQAGGSEHLVRVQADS